MKAWLRRMWSWLKADLSGLGEREEEEREHQEQEGRAAPAREWQNRRGETDGFRVAR